MKEQSDKFLQVLGNIIHEPPYVVIFLLSSVFVTVSISSGNYFQYSLLIFLYSIAGIFWRHIIIDLKKLICIEDISSIVNWFLSILYQLGNISLFIFLIFLLSKIIKL